MVLSMQHGIFQWENVLNYVRQREEFAGNCELQN